jgi:dephospho-CoA kinase
MKILGLTGGIGSGKTVVAETLRIMGVPVYNSDVRSKVLCDTDEELKRYLIDFFGPEIYVNGQMDRSYMSKRIFNDERTLKVVNALIHPAVERDFKSWVAEHLNCPVVVQETAILFEAGLEHFFDQIICVTAPEELRVERVCKRSGLSPEDVRARINNQISDNERISKSHIIVVNDGIQPILPQVERILLKLS